jgi:hypothetical protein
MSRTRGFEPGSLEPIHDVQQRQFLTRIYMKWRGVEAGRPLENFAIETAVDQIGIVTVVVECRTRNDDQTENKDS